MSRKDILGEDKNGLYHEEVSISRDSDVILSLSAAGGFEESNRSCKTDSY